MKGKTDCEGHKKGEMMMIVMTKKGNPIKGKSDERENTLIEGKTDCEGHKKGGRDHKGGKADWWPPSK